MLNQHLLELAELAKVSGRRRLLVKELQKPVIRKFGKHKVYSFLKDNIWDADFADIQLISKFNKEF